MKTTRHDTLLLSLVVAVAAAGLGSDAAAQQTSAVQVVSPYDNWNERGRLVSYKRVRTLTRWDVRQAMFDLPFLDNYAGFGLEDFFDFYTHEQIRDAAKYGVEVYQVVYETVDPFGVPTTASGAVLAPRRPLFGTLPTPAMVCWQRGTVFYDADVPSHGNMPDWGIWRGLLPASAGYVIAMPDLLGFGAAKHMVHTYNMAKPTATASVDMMRATRHLAAELGWALRNEVFLAGLSQGGHATLATQREVEAHHAAEFPLAGVAPSSGAYFISGVANAIFGSDVLIAPQVSTLLILAISELYGLEQPLSHYFRAPYDQVVRDLHDKSKTNAEVIAGLPTGPTNLLFTDEFLAAYRGTGEVELKAALQDNDLHVGWTPVAPIRLMNGEIDSVIPPVQAQAALAGLGGPGRDVQVVIFPGADHLQTIVPSTLYTIDWFDQLLGR